MAFARCAALALTFLGLVLVSAAASGADYHPWVVAETEFGEANVSIGGASDLVRSHISIANYAHVDSRVVHESRGSSDLDIFYSRHLVEPQTPLIVVTRRDSSEVIACTIPDTYVSANMFARGGRLDARTCLVDPEADGVFDEIRWSASRTDHHSLHSFHVISFDPVVATSAPYQRSPLPTGSVASMQAYLDVAIAYDPADGGSVRGTVTAPDGAVVVRDRIRLPRPNSAPREFQFFGFTLEVTRTGQNSFSWRTIRALRDDGPFPLAYDYRR